MPHEAILSNVPLTRDREHLFIQNQPLVTYIVQKYIKPKADDFEDYIQQGYLGLIHAVMNYDPALGTRFATYASQVILGYCQKYRRSNMTILHCDRAMHDLYVRIKRLQEQGLNDSQIQEQLNITPLEFYMASCMYTVASLDQPISKSQMRSDYSSASQPGQSQSQSRELSNLTLEGVTQGSVSAENQYIDQEIVALFISELEEMFKRFGIDSKQADVYREYVYSRIVGFDTKQVNLAKKYGYTQSYVSRILRKLNKQYYEHLRSKGLLG